MYLHIVFLICARREDEDSNYQVPNTLITKISLLRDVTGDIDNQQLMYQSSKMNGGDLTAEKCKYCRSKSPPT